MVLNVGYTYERAFSHNLTSLVKLMQSCSNELRLKHSKPKISRTPMSSTLPEKDLSDCWVASFAPSALASMLR